MQILGYTTERSIESTASHEGKIGLKQKFSLALEAIGYSVTVQSI